MLVLSRRAQEKIVIPCIAATVQVLSIRPGVVRIGIEAPPEVSVVREELLAKSPAADSNRPVRPEEPLPLRELKHMVRNRLSTASIGLALLRRQCEAGMTDAAEATLQKLDSEFQAFQQQVERTVESAALAPLQPRKALIVEDDPNERELLAGLLRLAGLDVDTAGDGSDALDYLRAHNPPDVLLLDMVLPRCDGPTLLRQLRRHPTYRKLKVFAISGHAPEWFGLQKEGCGVDRWFAKPLQPEQFLADLKRELGDTP